MRRVRKTRTRATGRDSSTAASDHTRGQGGGAEGPWAQAARAAPTPPLHGHVPQGTHFSLFLQKDKSEHLLHKVTGIIQCRENVMSGRPKKRVAAGKNLVNNTKCCRKFRKCEHFGNSDQEARAVFQERRSSGGLRSNVRMRTQTQYRCTTSGSIGLSKL